MNVKVNKKSVQKYEGIKNVTSFDISDSFKILRERYFSIGIRIFQPLYIPVTTFIRAYNSDTTCIHFHRIRNCISQYDLKTFH